MSRLDVTIDAKKEKRAQLEAKGVNPHAYSFDKQTTIADCREKEGETVTTAGRIFALRTHGKVAFLDLGDFTGQIQVMIRKDELAEFFDLLPSIDTGDFIGVTGEVTTSKTGEITIQTTEATFLGKALRPLPSQWNAAENKEARFRQRYLDMLINPDTKRVLDARWTILREIRNYLQSEHQFIEVETPILQPLYGGTNAKPFTTHMNALDTDFYLRVAPELYLKRLIVGGYDKVFEIARNFRNEGIDQTHQPEFTMIEWYEAYADYQRMMDVTEGLLKHLTNQVNGSTTLEVHDQSIDIGGEWPRITMKEAIATHLNIDFDSLDDTSIQNIMSENQIELIGEYTRGKALFAIFDKLVPEFLIEPTWVIDYPRDVSPLSKAHRMDPKLAERFECYIGGKEVADGWSEITDAVDQRNIFENEQQRMRDGDDEAHPLDEDFLAAMEYGMPPLGGIGIGIDRLVMFLTNTWSIKEVIAFPTLKPLNQPQNQTQKAAEPTVDTSPQTTKTTEAVDLPNRSQSLTLLRSHIKNEALLNHCYMVARAMEAYAEKLGADTELWYQTGLLHDIDWEEYPDEHPNKAIAEWFGEYPEALKQAVAAHAPDRTGTQPTSQLDKYLFACDELSGFMHAVSLMRPNGFDDMKYKSIKKKLKDKGFAANVSREDITEGAELIGVDLADHVTFLIEVFNNYQAPA